MKTSESILLIATVGLGVVLAATQLPGKGRSQPGQGPGASTPGADGSGAAPRQSPTIELLVAKRASLKPLSPTLRNPFRPPAKGSIEDMVAVGIRVTGIFGNEHGDDGRLSALVRGTLIGAEHDASLGVVHIARGEPGLAELLKGKRVHEGDTIGCLRVGYVSERGVVLLYGEERIAVKLHPQGADGAGGEHEASGTHPSETEPKTR